MSRELLKIATVTSPSGIKGFVKIRSLASNPADIFIYHPLSIGEERISLKKINRVKNGLFVCEIVGVTNREQAEKLRGKDIMIDRSALPELESDEHYAVDLLGFEVISKHGEKVGKVLNIINYGANDILEYETSSGDVVLIPLDAQFINGIDNKKKRIVLEHYEVV